jgi:hypothetical protein
LVQLGAIEAWFNWARSNRLAIASQQIDGVLHIYATDGHCYPYTEFVASHPLQQREPYHSVASSKNQV